MLGDLLGYRAALEDDSASTLPFIEWEPTPHGNVRVTSNTADLYRYFDATRQAEYLADCIERTVRIALPAELKFLHRFDDAKRRMAGLVDIPDRLVSLFIQFCVQDNGRLSARKRTDFFPGLSDELVTALEQAARASGITDPGVRPQPAHRDRHQVAAARRGQGRKLGTFAAHQNSSTVMVPSSLERMVPR